MKIFKIVSNIVRGVLVAVCLALAAYNIYVLVARYAFGNGMPTLFGLGGAAVVSGSMDDDSGDDDIEIGDFIITRSQTDYAVGEVITFFDPDFGEYVTHRVVLKSQAGYTTKGDNNNDQDTFTVPLSNIVGKVVYVVKGGGRAIQFVRSPAGLLVIIAAGAAVWFITDLLSAVFERRCKDKDERKD